MKETSPVFHQFLDAVYQLVYIHPNRFQFNERFLRRLLYHAYSCQYGSFLYDSEKERVEAKVWKRARCVWDYFLARRKEFINPEFDASLDIGEGVLFPKGDCVRWWAQAWGRTDAEMNGPGRGTNVREDTVKIREERKEKEEQPREDLQERLHKVMRTASPRKDLQIFDGVGSSPSRTQEAVNVENSPSRVKSSLPTEVLAESKDQFIEGNLSVGEPDPAIEDIPVIIEETNTAVAEASDDSLGGTGSVISSAVEDSGLSASDLVAEPLKPEFDPLGGGVEMTAFKIKSPSQKTDRIALS